MRDWVDVIECNDRLQALGYLAWAACGKDPGFSPAAILDHAARSHYSATEVASLSFEGATPDAAQLSTRWHAMLDAASGVIARLPVDEIGKVVLDRGGKLFTGGSDALAAALNDAAISFHAGSIRGALPRIIAG